MREASAIRQTLDRAAELRCAIEQYTGRGWRVVILRPRDKRPLDEGWTSAPPTVDVLLARLDGCADYNLGLLLGALSGGLVDVDLDSPEARALAPNLLPPTQAVFGRTGAPGSHWLYQTTPVPESRTFRAPGGRVLLELRADRRLVMVPPSIHPSGESVRWESDGEPGRVTAEALLQACARLASAVLLVRHWPAPGSRQHAALALGGVLARIGWDAQEAADFTALVARAAGDEEADKRARAAADTVLTHRDGQPTTAFPTLAELVGQDVARLVMTWLAPPTRRIGRYEYGPHGTTLVRTTAEGEERRPLANFVAWIDEVVTLDDDAERPRIFMLRGRVGDHELPALRVNAESFGGLTWVNQWAPRAIVSAGTATREHLREAIQRYSQDTPERVVYTHAGWRELPTVGWCFLHGRGALGADGPLPNIRVELPPQLTRYWLPTPPDLETARMVLAELVAFYQLADPRITAPLLGAVVAAPLGVALGAPRTPGGLTVPAGFLVWLLGRTGNWKSTLCALISHLVGGPWEDKGPPASWEASENALERLGHAAAYLPLWIDDFRPGATTREVHDLERRAQRFIRELANATGRDRMRADTTLRPPLWPRCLPLCSGEVLPGGTSTIARLLVVEVERELINRERLTAAQQRAPQAYPLAGAVLVQAIAREVEALRRDLPPRRDAVRDQLLPRLAHPQHASHAARLILAWTWLVDLLVTFGVVTGGEGERLLAEARDAIVAVAARSGQYGEDERPAQRFLDLLQALLRQRRVHLRRIEGTRVSAEPPEPPEMWGWSGTEPPSSPCVGWVDPEHGLVYLLPTPTLREIAEYTRNLPRRFAPSVEALGRDLAGAGLLARVDEGRHTYTKRVGGERPHTWAIAVWDIWPDLEREAVDAD